MYVSEEGRGRLESLELALKWLRALDLDDIEIRRRWRHWSCSCLDDRVRTGASRSWVSSHCSVTGSGELDDGPQ